MHQPPYQIILSDPPWSYRDQRGAQRGENHGGAAFHYRTMSREGLMALPVRSLADPSGCWLFMWATWPNLPLALDVMAAWGFTYITAGFVWVKTYGNHRDVRDDVALGLGSYSRANSEPCLLGRMGKIHRVAANVSQIIIAPRARHSAKPPIVRERIVQLAGDLPRIELFARGETPPGWAGWGDECVGDVIDDLLVSHDDPLLPGLWEGEEVSRAGHQHHPEGNSPA